MAGMDSLYLETVLAELQPLLPGSRIDKIYQTAAAELVFHLWGRGQSRRLLLSCEPGRSRLHLVEGTYPNPSTPPRFCQLLRARLRVLAGIEQPPGAGFVRLNFLGSNASRYQLYLEIHGRSGNLVLVDENGLVVDALHRQSTDQSRPASLAGTPYVIPPSSERILLEDAWTRVPDAADGIDFETWLRREVQPMSRWLARELSLQLDANRSPSRILKDFIERRRNGEHRYAILDLDGRPQLLCYAPHALEGKELAHFTSVSAGAEAYFREFVLTRDRYGSSNEMNALVHKNLKKLSRRRQRILQDEQKLELAEDLRRQGELLLANLHRPSPGDRSVTVEDYYREPPAPICIPLDPRLSPQKNAEGLFRNYKKIKRSREHIERRLAETDQEIFWLEGVALALAEARGGEEFLVIRAELAEQGLLRIKKLQRPKRESKKMAGIRETLSPGGFRLIWGVNNRANDYVSKVLCQADDLWFHVHDQPGCHLVLKRDNPSPIPEPDQCFAAAIAAAYSRSKNDRSVSVMVSEGRWVAKPKGARPGLVTVRQFKTLLVTPRREPADESPEE